MSEWRTIESAPKDGTVFLGYRDGRYRECYRVEREEETWFFGGTIGAHKNAPWLRPTHWMPLPEAPHD